MSKELAGEYFARVSMPLQLYKQLKEEHEMTLLKVYNKSHRAYYEKNEDWNNSNKKLKEYLEEKSKIEEEIRDKNKLV